MTDFELFRAKRRLKQLLVALLFLLILIGGWFYPFLGYFIPFCMLLGVGSGFYKGRKWCDWICPRGSFYDSLIFPISPKKEIPAFIKGNTFRVGIIIFLMSVMIFNLIIRWPDPSKIGKFFVMMLTATTLLGVILALIFHQRTWCSFCPIGSVIKWTSKNNLRINPDLCVECKLCAKVCPIQIKPYTFKSEGLNLVKNSDCLRCNFCIAVCPKKALSRTERGVE